MDETKAEDEMPKGKAKTDAELKEEHAGRVLRGEVDARVADLPNSEQLTRELKKS